jgi:hypothetical protein
MMTVECRVGRLGEVRWRSPITHGEVMAFLTNTVATIKAAKTRMVFCSDMRNTRVIPPDDVATVVSVLRNDNPMIERHGILIGAGAVFGLQIERILRDAGSPARRTFRDLDELIAWLSPVLSVEERARMRQFYLEIDGAGLTEG